MSFFPPHHERAPDPDPGAGGWDAYVGPRPEATDEPTRRVASDLVLADTAAAWIVVPAVDVGERTLRFEVRCTLHAVRGGEALRELLDAGRDPVEGASPPHDGLLVGVELADGERVVDHPVDGGTRSPTPLRLQRRGGGATASRDEPSVVREAFVLLGVPDRPLRIVCTFAAVAVTEASVTVDPRGR